MIKRNFILLTILTISIFSYGQSYIGFSGGFTDPMAYISLPKYSGHLKISNLESKNGAYFSIHIKERVEKNFNLGLRTSVSNLKLRYGHYDGGLGGGTGKRIEYDTYIFLTQIEFEIRLIKNAFYLNFGPIISAPFYSYKKETGSNWSIAYYGRNYFSYQGKNKDGLTNFKLFTGITLEKPLSEKTIVFINSQISYSLWGTYEGVNTLDLNISLGIQFFLPKFTLFEKKLQKKPPVLNKKNI
ncbi:MAG: hypothetical protein ACPGSO_05015 [Vicingaceae bacterium]